LIKEYHLFSDIEVANLLIQDLKALEAALIQIKLIVKRNIVYLLQPQLDLADVEQTVVYRGTQLIN
jgi:hypothetical protein